MIGMKASTKIKSIGYRFLLEYSNWEDLIAVNYWCHLIKYLSITERYGQLEFDSLARLIPHRKRW